MKQLLTPLLLVAGCAACALTASRVHAQLGEDPAPSATPEAEGDPGPGSEQPVGGAPSPGSSGPPPEPTGEELQPETQAASKAAPDATPPAEALATGTAPGPVSGDSVVSGLPEDAKSWEPPAADMASTKWDWVLLTTGEWLKGTIETFRDGDMTFDSDQFGLQVLDMDDVAGFYALQPHLFMLDDRQELAGTGTLRGDELVINGTTLTRARLMSLVEGSQREIDFWSFKLNLSLSVRNGNTDQTTFSDRFFTRREAPSNRFTIDSNGTFGRVDGEVTVETQTGLAQLDIFVSKKLYLTPALLTGTHDRFQNIAIRLSPAAGAGVHVFDLDNLEWDVEAGAGYQYLRYLSVPMGDQQVFNDAMTRFSTRLSAEVGDPLDIDFTWATTLVVTDLGRTYHHGTITFALEVTDTLDATISAVYDRLEQPAERDDGTVPKKDDLQINFGIQLDV